MSDSDPLAQVEQLYEQKVAALDAEYEVELAALKQKHDSALIERLLRIERWIREKLQLLGAPDRPPLDQIVLKAFHELKQEIQNMGTSLSAQLTAAQAETSAALDGIATDVSEIAADVDLLLQGTNPGDPVTQAMVDAMTSIRDRAVAAKSGLDAVNAKVPAGGGTTPVHTAQDTSDTTLNGQPRPDGSRRNNFFMDGFDATQPETT